jgi:hypothetical protein
MLLAKIRFQHAESFEFQTTHLPQLALFAIFFSGIFYFTFPRS